MDLIAQVDIMAEINWIDVLQTFGLPVVLVLFFVWQSKIREDRMSERLDHVEDYMRDQFATVIRENTQIVAENTRVMQQLERHLTTLPPRSDP